MKLKTTFKLLLVSLLALFGLVAEAQTTISIGSGTLSSWLYGPMYRSSATSTFDFNRTAYIYTNAELNIPTGAVIQKVEWFKTTVDTFVSPTYSYFDIWMSNTTNTTAASTAWTAVTGSSTRVLKDSFNVTKNIRSVAGWNEFTITPFTYSGNSLQIAVDFNSSPVTGNPSSGAFSWQYETAPASRTFYYNGSTVGATLSTVTALRPNIRITYTYTPPANDAGLVAITSPNAVSCAGTQPVSVDLRNYGTSTLTTATINWSLAGVAQTPYSWTGSLASNASTSVNVGSVLFASAPARALKIWTSAPNGMADGAAYNDTLSRTISTGMNGNFTVGGSGSPDYATLTAAITALKTNGMCGNVRLLVNSGTYTGQYDITGIAGLGAAATLEIVSNPSNATKPVFTYGATTTTDNFVFQLNNVRYVTLDSLDIRPTGTVYGRGVAFANNTGYITVSNSTVRGLPTVTNSSNTALIYCNTTTSLDEYITIENNVLRNGAYGIYLYGSSTVIEQGSKVLNNDIDSFYYYGIYSYYQQGVEISGNYLKDANTATSPYGLYCLYSSSAKITNNTVLLGGSLSPNGMYLDYNDGTVANPTYITNNMISMYSTATSTVTGMEVYAAENNYVANNTIAVYGGSTSARALYLFASLAADTIKSYNNALANFGGGYSLYATTSNAGIVANDHNSYYSSGTNLAYWGSAVTSLAALKTATGKDVNSIAVEPLFVSNLDLRTTTPDLDAAALALPYVTTDIDGDARNASTPDIGADEFTPPPVDAGIVSMVGSSFCAGTINNDVVLQNFATDTLRNVKIVRSVAINGGAFTILDTLSWTGLLATAQSEVVSLGTYVIGADNYTFRFYTSKPNNITDPNKANDTLTLNVVAAMQGTYTVGGTSPDYASFALLSADLATKGMCDDVVIDVREGTYNEQIVVGPISGLSAMNTLTVRSDAANTTMPVITFEGTSVANYVVLFQNTSNVSVDGIELRTTGTTYSRVIGMESGVSDINITNCKIVGMPNAASTSTFRAAVFMNSTGANNRVKFENNEILHGASGIYSVQSSANPGDSLLLINNKIDSFYYYGVYSTYSNHLIIRENYIADDNSYTSPRGIYALYNNPMEVTSNEVYIGGSSAPNGMYLDYNDGTLTNPTIISNNMISMYSTSASSTVTGMEVYNAENNIVANNSIAVYGGGTVSRALYLFASGTLDSVAAYNNALANYGGNYALYAGTSTAIKASDYNSVYSTGANVGYWNAAARATLADMQAASGFDANSVTADPVFISPMNLRAKGSGINNVATPLSYVTTDLDGDLRDPSTPDIGADEFTPPADDIAIVEILNEIERCAVTSQEIRVVITNLGTNTQNGVNVELNITGALSQTLTGSSTASLATGDVDTVSLGFFSSAVGGVFNFEAYALLPGDEDLSNDTTMLNGVQVDALPMAPSVSDVNVCIADASSASLTASGAAVSYAWYASEGATTVLSTNATYMPNVTSTDTFYVQGNYSSAFNLGPVDNTLGGGGNYTTLTDGLVFDVINPITLDSVTVYPNAAGNVVVNILDASGASVFTTTVAVTTTSATRIAVGATLSPGNDYRINAVGTTTGGLYRNSGGATMPYSDAGGNVSIKNTINNLAGFYYFYYDWAITAGGCSSPRARAIVKVNETAQPTIANDTICSGDDAYLNVTSVGNQITWYTSATSTTPIAVGYSYVYGNATATKSFFVKDLGTNGCTSIPKEAIVVVKATPAIPTTSDAAICTGESATLSATGTTGMLSWYASATGGAALSVGTTYTTAALTRTKVYYVSEMIDGCEGPRQNVVVSVNAKPDAPIAASVAPVCAGESATVVASGANVTWYNAAMNTVVGTGNSYITGALSATDTFFAVDMISGCSSDATQTIVLVNEVPMAPTSTDQSICEGSSATLTASSSANNTWYNAADMSVFSGDVYTTPALSANTSYYVAASDGNCTSDKTWVTVFVSPSADADQSVTSCQNQSVTLALASGMMYNWYEDATTSTVLATGATYMVNPSTTDTFYAQAIGGNCTDTRTMYVINVDEAAELTAVSGASICEGEVANLTAVGTGNISWYASNSSTTAIGSGATLAIPALTSTSIFYAQSSNGTCASDRLPAIVTVNPTPNADFVAEDHGSRVFVSAAETSRGYIHTWTIGGTSLQSEDPSTFLDGSAVGTVTVIHTITNSITGCSATSTADVTIAKASVSELSLSNIGLYPNPNTGNFVISLPKANEKYTVKMLNIAGQEVYSNSELTTDNNAVNVNVPAGMYFVQISDGVSNTTVKVIVE